MIILDTTLRVIEVVLAGSISTNQLDVVTSYVDITATTYTPGTTHTVTNNTTEVTIVPSPASGKKRQVKFMSVHNCDTASATVTVQLADTDPSYTYTRKIYKAVLAVGDTLFYENGSFRVLDDDGKLKTSTA